MNERKITVSFFAAPYRLFFWSGALYAMLIGGGWSLQQFTVYAPLFPHVQALFDWPQGPMLWVIPYNSAHGFTMLYLLMGYYLAGFLLTVFPRRLGAEPVSGWRLIVLWGLLMAGSHGFWVGLFFSQDLLTWALVLIFTFYLGLMWALWSRLLRASRERAALAPVLVGLTPAPLGVAMMLFAVLGGHPEGYPGAMALGLNGFILPLALGVSHLMIPFFTQVQAPGLEVRRTELGGWLFVGLCWVRGTVEWYGPVGASAVVDLALFLALVRELVWWRFWRAPLPPLLRVMYLGLGWLLVGLALYVGQGLSLWLEMSPAPPFGKAPLHAILVGGVGSLLLGISSRITLGQSGRAGGRATLAAGLFLAFQGVALARVVPEVVGYWWPIWAVQGFWSGGLWALVFGVWLVGVGSVLWRARPDGQPG